MSNDDTFNIPKQIVFELSVMVVASLYGDGSCEYLVL